MMKKYLSVIMALAIIMSLFGCAKNSDDGATTQAPTSESTTLNPSQTSETNTQQEEESSVPTDDLDTTESTTKAEEDGEEEPSSTTNAPTTTTTTKQNTTNPPKIETTKPATPPPTNTKKPKPEKKPKPSIKPNKPAQKPEPTHKPTDGSISDEAIGKMESKFLSLVNAERKSKGARALKTNKHLYNCSKTRSDEITTKFSHTRPNGQSCDKIVDTAKYPYWYIGENIAQITLTDYNITGTNKDIDMIANEFFNALKNSPPHYKNMIDKDFEDTGVGITYRKKGNVTYIYLTQIFGSK